MNSVKRVSLAEEFRRNPELKKEDLQHLRDWCAKQPHYPKNIPDTDLVIFLHSNYYRLEPTKVTIENYYSCRTHVPEFFGNRDPLGSKELRSVMKTLGVLILDQKTREGYGVIYVRLIDLDVDKFNYNVGMRLFSMMADLWLIEGGTIKGQVIVVDISGVQMAHVLRIPPLGVKKYLFYLQEALPFRIKTMHFMNTTSVMDFILGLMKPFLKKELMDVLYLHPTLDSMKKHLPVEILPNEAGGKAGPMTELVGQMTKKLEDNRDFFIEEEEVMRINESLRPGKAKSASDLFGIEGSFKKLDID